MSGIRSISGELLKDQDTVPAHRHLAPNTALVQDPNTNKGIYVDGIRHFTYAPYHDNLSISFLARMIELEPKKIISLILISYDFA
ncbi:hypothetical protein PENVUL_c001G00980 [Penicillium vulpinum]|uniref:Uncharacterized protein n=1 Tax=Penicillium vulpinum TaxID=29845 RepID=A0A1V6SEC1_9EURO|nr:hypothetical protein PENVUL_c001G00980 [Penicillium vulpinum]